MKSKNPPIFLDEAPPVFKNCTKREVNEVFKISFVVSITVFIVTIFIFVIFEIFDSIALKIIFSLITSFVAHMGFTYWLILKIGKIKNNQSSRYILQIIEKYKNKIGIADKRIIYRNGEWSTHR